MNLIENTNGNNICQCNNCDTVMFDENPQIGAKKYSKPNNVIVFTMEFIEGICVCPKCKTDEFLKDL